MNIQFNLHYPVLSAATILVDLTKAKNLKITICDIEGKTSKLLADKIYNRGEWEFYLNTNDLVSGTYTLVVEFDNKKHTSNIVIYK